MKSDLNGHGNKRLHNFWLIQIVPVLLFPQAKHICRMHSLLHPLTFTGLTKHDKTAACATTDKHSLPHVKYN
jgi:hypothetical protein